MTHSPCPSCSFEDRDCTDDCRSVRVTKRIDLGPVPLFRFTVADQIFAVVALGLVAASLLFAVSHARSVYAEQAVINQEDAAWR